MKIQEEHGPSGVWDSQKGAIHEFLWRLKQKHLAPLVSRDIFIINLIIFDEE